MFGQSFIKYVKEIMYASRPKIYGEDIIDVPVEDNSFLSSREVITSPDIMSVDIESVSDIGNVSKDNSVVVFYTRWPMESGTFADAVNKANPKEHSKENTGNKAPIITRFEEETLKAGAYNWFDPIEPPVVSALLQSEMEEKNLLGKDIAAECGIVILFSGEELTFVPKEEEHGDERRSEISEPENSDIMQELIPLNDVISDGKNTALTDGVILDTIETLLKKEKLTHEGALDCESIDKKTKLGPVSV